MTPFQVMRLRRKWDPSMLQTPLRIWLDHTSTVTDVSGNASQWNDKTSNALNYSQSTAGSRPLIVASGLNSKRTLRFDGTDDCLTCNIAGALSMFQDVGSGYVFFVSKKTTTDVSPTHRTIIQSVSGTGGTRHHLQMGSADAGANKPEMGVRRLDADSFARLDGPSAVDTNFHMYLGVQNWSTREGRIFQDGAVIATNATLTASAGNTSNTASSVASTIGAASGGTVRFADAEIAAVLVGRAGMPSAADIDCLFGWAAHTYGLQSLLPSGHPYKVVAP